MTDEITDNCQYFRDALAASVVAKLSNSIVKASKKRRSKGRRSSTNVSSNDVQIDTEGSGEGDVAELSEFIEVDKAVSCH